jgi:uncharacterized ParB-like nuclease family protein
MKSFGFVALTLVWLAAATGLLAQEKQHQTLTGVVSNTHCKLNHSKADAGQAGCVNMCVKGQGASYALVVGDKVYALEGMSPELAKLAGVNAKLTGHVKGMSMHVEKVEASK